ncbi:hypothetical protein HHI36_019172 [Cryptolaemus montrouzieri]|uniref:Uncharacterized protein n=1 Tax=Cryptolaemus montrouzieri TaxID=559131 RepID=A0ABD2P2P1_9CUCU
MGNRFLPFDSWYPYPYLESPWFELSYIHQCIATSFNHFMHTGIDCLYSGLMAIVGSQCDFLRYKILEYKQPGEFGVPINNIDSLKEDDLDYESFFKNIVKHHKHILG